MAVFRRRGPPDGNQMIPVTETSTLGRRRNGTNLCRACKIAPARSRFDRLSVKSGRFVRSGLVGEIEAAASPNPAQQCSLTKASVSLIAEYCGVQRTTRPSRCCATRPAVTRPRRWKASVEGGTPRCDCSSPIARPSPPARTSRRTICKRVVLPSSARPRAAVSMSICATWHDGRLNATRKLVM